MSNNTHIEHIFNNNMISSTLINADENIGKYIITLLKKNPIHNQNIVRNDGTL